MARPLPAQGSRLGNRIPPVAMADDVGIQLRSLNPDRDTDAKQGACRKHARIPWLLRLVALGWAMLAISTGPGFAELIQDTAANRTGIGQQSQSILSDSHDGQAHVFATSRGGSVRFSRIAPPQYAEPGAGELGLITPLLLVRGYCGHHPIGITDPVFFDPRLSRGPPYA